MRRLFCKKTALITLGVLLLATGIGWWQRTPILAWHYVRQLAQAAERERAAWVERVASLDSAAFPGLHACLKCDDARACANAEAALLCLTSRWGADDSRSLQVIQTLSDDFAHLSAGGQRAVLALLATLLRTGKEKTPPVLVTQSAGRLLQLAAPSADEGVRHSALVLAELLVQRSPGQWLDVQRALVLSGLRDAAKDNRVRAVHLTLRSELRRESDLLDKVAPLLRDSSAEVRRAALLAVGMAEKTVAEDELLPLLHDADAEVRRLCETALRGRGLSEDHLRLARWISDPLPSARLQVLEHLWHVEDLDVNTWLRRLTQDTDVAVRAAAVRAAATQTLVDLSDRLRQMAHDDPSPTVRQLAAFWWQYHQRMRRTLRP